MPLTSDQAALANILANYGTGAQQYIPSTGGYGAPGESVNEFMGVPTRGMDSTSWQLDAVNPLTYSAPGLTGAIGNFSEGNNTAGALSLLSGGFSDLIGGLFGRRRSTPPQWQPYADAQGRYYWTSPSTANPVPLSGIPGAGIAPTAEYTAMANQIRSIQDLLPYYSQAISAQKIPDAMGQLAADTATTGPRLALQESLQRQYGPIFDQLAAESNLRRSTASAANDAAVLKGPGQELIQQALAAAKLYDPEYFATRATTADSVQKLLGQTTANLGSGLSNTERDEVGRGLALSNARAGTTNAPSQLNTVQNAMQFGAAGRQRETENQNQLAKAISASTQFLPTAKSNVDVFQVATGKPSYNQQDNRFNTNNALSDASSSAQGLLNTGASFWNTNANNAARAALQDDQQNDWGNRLGQISGALGNFSGLLGVCWVAREVYGNENPRWLQFRHWLFTKAPDWLFNWYCDNGEAFAKYISDKPLLKRMIRWWMDSRIKKD